MAEVRPHLPTLVLGTLAGWAALAALVAYTGLGGRYALHPDDHGLVPPVPAIDLARAESRLGPVEDYAVIGQRPLFNPDRQPTVDESAEGSDDAPVEEVAPPLDVTLTGVILSGDVKIALLSDNRSRESQSVRLGASLEGDLSSWKLAQLEPRRAVFEGPTGRTEVELRVFDGKGGQSPTPLGRQPGTESQAGEAGDGKAELQGEPGEAQAEPQAEEMTPETRAEMIRRRIEERRRQMREEAARANQEGN